jgi:hypothetical protein
MIGMPEIFRAKSLVAHVEFGVRRRHHDHARSRRAEYRIGQRAETRRIDVLDDFHHRSRIEAGETLIAIG